MAVWDFDKEVANEFDNKYKIRMKIITKGNMELYQFFISDIDFETSNILFTKSEETGYFEPYIYNYHIDKDGKERGSIITKNTAYYDWIMTVRESFQNYNKKKKRYENGSLYVLQWIITFEVIRNIIEGTGRVVQLMATRQLTKGCL